MQGALRSCEDGVLLDIDVKPAADVDRFPDGYNEWRERIGARVRSPARDGQANRAIVELVARALDLETDHVGLKRGHTSRRKTLVIRGSSIASIASKLEEVHQP